MEVGEFHWTDGWYFKRMPDGSVRIQRRVNDGKLREEYIERTVADATIPAAEWASIVCSVSAKGETGERWNEAQDFHGR